ncbi:MAG: tRNA lysidine(34) synthetase TilS [Lachnospiraceae bacterium]|nr:tRNA lysidine(34) synthetase TilS [Lachnospiraceae bacterium]
MDFIARVEKQLEQFHMLSLGDRVVLGVSGGADSMCLLEVLHSLRESYALTLFVVHVHHGIRGDEADEDARFVQEACEQREIACRVIYEDVPAVAKAEGCSVEEAGRLVRYRAFAEAARECNCSRIAVAHNRNDQAETVLFHAFRGSGLRGLCGIPACRENIIRPLLGVSRAEIEEFLLERQLTWRTDATNLTADYTRNRIRHQILPTATEGVNAKAAEHLAELAVELGRVQAYLEQEADKRYPKVVLANAKDDDTGTVRCLSVNALQETPQVLREQLWLRIWKELAGRAEDFGRVHIKALEELLVGDTGRSLHLPYGIRAEKSYEQLQLRRMKEQEPSEEPKNQKISELPCTLDLGKWELRLSLILFSNDEKNVKIPKSNYTKWFDYDKIGNSLALRRRLPGDYMIIHKDGSQKSLKSLLIDRKVPRAEREQLALLAAGSRILWCIGVRSEDGLYVDENTKRVLVAELREKG